MTSNRLLWEQHTCPPLSADARLGELRRYRRAGGTFASVNVGYAPHSADEVRTLLAAFRAGVALEVWGPVPQHQGGSGRSTA